MSRQAQVNTTAVMVAVLLTAFNLRIGIVEVGPVVEQIRADTGMSSALAGVLTTIPFFCMGLFAFVGTPLIHRYGGKLVIAIGLALIVGGTILRAIVPGPILLLGATFPIGIGVALIGVTLPSVIKDHFPRRPGAATGAYVASLSLGIALVGVSLVPLADLLGGWRAAFAVTAIPAAIAFAVWVSTHFHREPRDPQIPIRIRLGVPRRPIVMLAAAFGLQSLCFAAMVGWAPAVYQQGGWSEQTASLTTTTLGMMNIIGSLTLPALSDGSDRRLWLCGTLAVQTLGVLGLALFGTGGGLLWVVLFGFGNGSTFALMLSLPIDLCEKSSTVADVSKWMLGLGYLIAAAGPLVVGALRDITADFHTALIVLAAISFCTAVIILLSPRRIAPHEILRS